MHIWTQFETLWTYLEETWDHCISSEEQSEKQETVIALYSISVLSMRMDWDVQEISLLFFLSCGMSSHRYTPVFTVWCRLRHSKLHARIHPVVGVGSSRVLLPQHPPPPPPPHPGNPSSSFSDVMCALRLSSSVSAADGADRQQRILL